MNKNLKKIVAIAMAVGTLSAVTPINKLNLLTTAAYASSDSSNDDDKFDNFKLETSDGSSIKVYDDDNYDSDNKVDSKDIDSGTDYYAKTSSDKVKIDIDGVSSKYVRVFKSDNDDISSSAKSKKVSDDISLSSGDNTIVVRIYSEEPDGTLRYDEDDDQLSDYTIHIKCTADDSSSSDSSNTSDSSDDNSDDYDAIYLDSISIDGDSVSLSDSKTTYTYNVASSVDSVTIKAKPQDEDTDTVYIDGDKVDDGDKYKKDVDLNEGENDIKVKVKNDDSDKREYTLKITRGTAAVASTGTSNTTATSGVVTQTATAATTAVKCNQWIQINGGWQYNDSTGQPIKNQWFFDRNYGKWYYLGADGMMAHDTYIGIYRVGSDGAWIV